MLGEIIVWVLHLSFESHIPWWYAFQSRRGKGVNICMSHLCTFEHWNICKLVVDQQAEYEGVHLLMIQGHLWEWWGVVLKDLWSEQRRWEWACCPLQCALRWLCQGQGLRSVKWLVILQWRVQWCIPHTWQALLLSEDRCTGLLTWQLQRWWPILHEF